MSVEQVVTIVLSVGMGIGGGAAIICGLASWLGKVWAHRILEQDRLRYQRELESVKTELGRASQEYVIKFSSLHVKRAEIIRELHAKLMATRRAMGSVLKPFQLTGEPAIGEKIKALQETFNDFYRFYLNERIYFPKKICTKIEELALFLRDIHIDITTCPVDLNDVRYSVSPALLEKNMTYWKQAGRDFDEKAVPLAEEIESEFRKMLGVE